jgi:hypothetical protein
LSPERPPYTTKANRHAREDYRRGCRGGRVRTLSDLRAALSDIPRERVDAAVTSLVVVGLVRVTRGERIHPGEPLVRMDAIGLVGV